MKRDKEDIHLEKLERWGFKKSRRSGGIKHDGDFNANNKSIICDSKYRGSIESISMPKKELIKLKRDVFISGADCGLIFYESKEGKYWLIPDEYFESFINYIKEKISEKREKT